MKRFMLTTALVAMTLSPALAQSQLETRPDAAAGGAEIGAQAVPAFLATGFTGKALHTVTTEDARALRGTEDGGPLTDDARTTRWTSGDVFRDARDDWENVGTINDIVMTKDGQIRGVLVDVGGFLGMFGRTVMVDMDELFFVPKGDGPADELSDYMVIAALTREDLEALPVWEDDRLDAGFERRDYAASGALDTSDNRDSDMAATDDREFEERADLTADQLMGADVRGQDGDSIGSVEDVVMQDDATIEGFVLDIGGFLGIGAHRVMLPRDDVRVLWNAADEEARVTVSMNREQLEALPAYDG